MVVISPFSLFATGFGTHLGSKPQVFLSLFESLQLAGSTTASENDTDVQLDDVQAWLESLGCFLPVHSMGLAYLPTFTLLETNSSPLKIGRNPIGKACLPTINFEVRTVSFRECTP